MSDKMVHAIMKPNIIAIGENATMRQAVELIRTNRIRHLPVTNSSGRIVGLLSDRDVRRVQSAMKLNDFEQSVMAGESHPVKNYMNSPVLEAKASEPIGVVVRRMLHAKISCFLVVDEYTAPCGIVTTDDLLKYLVDVIEEREFELNAPVGTLFQFLKVPTYE